MSEANLGFQEVFFKVKKNKTKTSETTQTSLKNFIQKGDIFSPLEQFIIEFS